MKRLALVGGGHSHVEVIRRFGLDAPHDSEILLISPGRFTPYSGMLPGLIAGHYDHAASHIDLDALTRAARVRFVYDVVTELDPRNRSLMCASGTRYDYDVVSLDIGSALTRDLLQPDDRRGVAVKPTEHFLAHWARVAQRAMHESLSVVMVGAGAAGVEVTLAMQHHLRGAGARPARFVVVGAAPSVLHGHSTSVQRRFARVLRERGVEMHLGSKVEEASAHHVRLQTGETIDADWVVWALGPRASPWVAQSGIHTDAQGFALIDEQLRSVSHPEVFAAGDIATMRDHPRPKSGVYAVRQGPPLAANLRAALDGGAVQSYVPQRLALALISTGDRYAVASRGALAVEGSWVWRWKDHIDRKFMARYRE